MYDKHLDSLIAVADQGSFSKAAQQLYISSNALIKQINLLEDKLGIVLFERTNHGVILTEAGRSIYHDAKKIIRLSNQAIETARDIEKNGRPSIRIGTSLMRPCKTIVDKWLPIQQKWPEVTMQIIPFRDTRHALGDIVENLGKDIDVVACIYPSTLWQNRCNVLQLSELPLCCAVSRNHPLSSKEVLHMEDLYGYTLMMVERGDTSYIDKLRNEIERKHPQIHIHNVAPYDIDVFNECERSNGIMITIETWRDIHPGLVTIPCEWKFTTPYGIIYPLNPSPFVETFVKAFEQEWIAE